METINFFNFYPIFTGKKSSFVTEVHFIVLIVKKTFSGVKLSENDTYSCNFEKNTPKRLKVKQKRKNFGQELDFSQNGPNRRIPDQVFWIQHSIWIQKLQNLKRILQFN